MEQLSFVLDVGQKRNFTGRKRKESVIECVWIDSVEVYTETGIFRDSQCGLWERVDPF